MTPVEVVEASIMRVLAEIDVLTYDLDYAGHLYDTLVAQPEGTPAHRLRVLQAIAEYVRAEAIGS